MLILLTDNSDYTTDIIVEWLKYYQVQFVRINATDLLKKSCYINISSNDIYLQVDNKVIDVNDIKLIWNRKFASFAGSADSALRNFLYSNISYDAKRAVVFEMTNFRNALFYLLDNNRGITWVNTDVESPNKIKQLLAARKVGFKIPETTIANTFPSLEGDGGNYITKTFGASSFYTSKKELCLAYTNRLENNIRKVLPASFLPSLIQREVKKKYEIRVFFFLGKCYSMAIISQLNKKTSVDFRRYDKKKPNRTCAFVLPSSIENKVVSFMQELNLSTGSVDIIVDDALEYYFLEVNPLGQFGMVSYPCNYYIEKEIAFQIKKIIDEESFR